MEEINYSFKEPWRVVGRIGQGLLGKELRSELSKEHELYRKKLIALATNDKSEDVLFFDEERNKFYVIELTGSGKKEKTSNIPKFEIMDSVNDILVYED